jgi:hypothetical protein
LRIDDIIGFIRLMTDEEHERERKKNHLLFEYAAKGCVGGVLMAIQAGARVNYQHNMGCL